MALGLNSAWQVSKVEFPESDGKLQLWLYFWAGSTFPCSVCAKAGCGACNSEERIGGTCASPAPCAAPRPPAPHPVSGTLCQDCGRALHAPRKRRPVHGLCAGASRRRVLIACPESDAQTVRHGGHVIYRNERSQPCRRIRRGGRKLLRPLSKVTRVRASASAWAASQASVQRFGVGRRPRTAMSQSESRPDGT